MLQRRKLDVQYSGILGEVLFSLPHYTVQKYTNYVTLSYATVTAMVN
jgi:hypothetical protein